MDVSLFLMKTCYAGWIIETETESYTGKYLYGDFVGDEDDDILTTPLNTCSKIPFIGIVAGITRAALGIIHVIGHVFAAAVTRDKGHLYHALKGSCEVLRGLIESIPVIGRIFSNLMLRLDGGDAFGRYATGRSWMCIKIYNPKKPDGLDQVMNLWEHRHEANKTWEAILKHDPSSVNDKYAERYLPKIFSGTYIKV